MTTTDAYVDRIEASEILKVSTRTIDRYMRKYRLKTRKDGRRVLIRKVDVDRIIQDQVGPLLGENQLAGPRESLSNLVVTDINLEKKAAPQEKSSAEDRVYKELYAETKKNSWQNKSA
ncbi:helix-turn-helix domain-containing protein [Candidatus Peregrinibacteria bacterium]|nr:MAG: helix-turn-helix domain-containing protein [Candidatus Peregrinibacteria bacterium]